MTDIRLDPPRGSKMEIVSVKQIHHTWNKYLSEGTKFNQNLDFKKLPFIWPNYDDENKWRETKVLKSFSQIKCSPTSPAIIDFGSSVNKAKGNYIYLKVQSETQTKITLVCVDEPSGSINFDVLPHLKPQGHSPTEYLIRISTLWNWMKSQSNRLEIKADAPLILVSVELREGD